MKIFVTPEEDKEQYLSSLPKEITAGSLPEHLLVIAAVDGEKEKLCGMIVADASRAEWDLIYIYVDSDYRRQGIGTGMIYLLWQTAIGTMAEGVMTTYIKHTAEPEEIDRFFEEMGAVITETHELYRTHVKSLEESFRQPVSGRPGVMVKKLSDIPDHMWTKLRQKLISRGEEVSEEVVKDNLPVFIDPGDRNSYNDELSFAYINQTGDISGVILVSEKKGGILIDYLVMLEKGASSKKALMMLLAEAVDAALQCFGEDTWVYADTENKLSKLLMLKLSNQESELCSRSITREII